MIHKTHLRIIKMYRNGISLERIAKRIGRPKDIERIKQALIEEGILLKEKNNE